jgi:hypothetical protein
MLTRREADDARRPANRNSPLVANGATPRLPAGIGRAADESIGPPKQNGPLAAKGAPSPNPPVVARREVDEPIGLPKQNAPLAAKGAPSPSPPVVARPEVDDSIGPTSRDRADAGPATVPKATNRDRGDTGPATTSKSKCIACVTGREPDEPADHRTNPNGASGQASKQQQASYGYKVLPRSYWSGASWRWRSKSDQDAQ